MPDAGVNLSNRKASSLLTQTGFQIMRCRQTNPEKKANITRVISRNLLISSGNDNHRVLVRSIVSETEASRFGTRCLLMGMLSGSSYIVKPLPVFSHGIYLSVAATPNSDGPASILRFHRSWYLTSYRVWNKFGWSLLIEDGFRRRFRRGFHFIYNNLNC